MKMGFSLNQVVTYKGQTYQCVAIKPHKRINGTYTELAVWKSHCAECGASFRMSTPKVFAEKFKFSPNRRCAKHKRPGSKIKGASKD